MRFRVVLYTSVFILISCGGSGQSGPSQYALGLLKTNENVRVRDEKNWTTYRNVRLPASKALLWIPEEGVNPQAYLPLMLPLVDAGFLVVMAKSSSNDNARQITRTLAGIDAWSIGGHGQGALEAWRIVRETAIFSGLIMAMETIPPTFSLAPRRDIDILIALAGRSGAGLRDAQIPDFGIARVIRWPQGRTTWFASFDRPNQDEMRASIAQGAWFAEELVFFMDDF